MSEDQDYTSEELCGCSDSDSGLAVGDVTVSDFDLEGSRSRAVIETKGGCTARGQNEKKCPTRPLTLHVNLTRAAINVSGDLVVDARSCPVKIRWANGPAGAVVFPPGTNLGITVPLPAGGVMTGFCVPSKKKLCKWSFIRTSP